jgi:hypothetical protein
MAGLAARTAAESAPAVRDQIIVRRVIGQFMEICSEFTTREVKVASMSAKSDALMAGRQRGPRKNDGLLCRVRPRLRTRERGPNGFLFITGLD